MKLDRNLLTYGCMSVAAAFSVGYATLSPAARQNAGLTAFSAGSVASAAEVNGNFAFLDGKATQNATNIATNAGNISKNTANTANTANIGTNTAAISKNAGKVTTNTGAIAANVTGIGKNRKDIASLQGGALGAVKNINGVKPDATGRLNLVGTGSAKVTQSGNTIRVDAQAFTGIYSSGRVPAVQLTGTKVGSYGNNGSVNITAHGAKALYVRAGTGFQHSGNTTGIDCRIVPTSTGTTVHKNIGIAMVVANGKLASQASNVGISARVGDLDGQRLSFSTGVDVLAVAQISSQALRGEAKVKSGGSAYGVTGKAANSSTSYAVFAAGKLGSTVTKAFIHPHPKSPSKVVEFLCLEGNEAGTYFRGTGRLSGGTAAIDIPKAWQHVTAKAGLTVHLTPIRSLARIAVWDMKRDKITVRSDEDCEFSFIVHGKRRGFEQHVAVRKNVEFKPTRMGVPFGTQYPRAYRNLLVENGILNANYTPNLETAKRLGWALREPTQDELKAAVAEEAEWVKSQDAIEAMHQPVRAR